MTTTGGSPGRCRMFTDRFSLSQAGRRLVQVIPVTGGRWPAAMVCRTPLRWRMERESATA